MGPEIEALDHDVMRLFDVFHRFKVRLAGTPQGRKRTPRHIALAVITARQIENLDAVRVLTVAGRPFAAYTVLRSIYEGYLYGLLIGFHQGSIAASRARKGERWTCPTQMQLARRFLRFRDHVLLQHEEYYGASTMRKHAAPLGLSDADAARRISLRRHIGQRVRSLYGWSQYAHTWHPFNGIRGLRDHLWPPGGAPVFPAGLFREGYGMWLHTYFYAYRETSRYVHGSGYGLFSNYNTATGQVEDMRRTDERPLVVALRLVSGSVEACAGAVGALGVLHDAASVFAHGGGDPPHDPSTEAPASRL